MKMLSVTAAALLLVCLALAGCDDNDDDDANAAGITVTTSVSEGGSVIPSSIALNSGQSTQFQVTAENGFRIDRISGCNGSLTGDSYTTDSLSENCQIDVTFIPAIADSCYAKHPLTIAINTPGGAAITSKDDYIDDALLDIDGQILTTSIKGRGNSTWLLPKKPYRLKLDDATALLGMPSARNWALLANYYDPTSLRNHLGFCLSATLNLEYTPRSAFVEVYLNGHYDGIYQFTEHREVGPDRVDIGDAETDGFNGFFLEWDWRYGQDPENVWFITSVLNVPFVDKSDSDLSAAQIDDAHAFMNAVETALTSEDFESLADKVDIASMIDFYLVNELLRNPDVFDTSTFLTRRHDEKLRFGPVWDFDLAAGIPITFADYGPTGYGPKTKRYISQAFDRFPEFEHMVAQRWQFLRIRLPLIREAISDSAMVLSEAKQRDNDRWRPANPDWSQPSFAREVERLQVWLDTRIAWLDSEWL